MTTAHRRRVAAARSTRWSTRTRPSRSRSSSAGGTRSTSARRSGSCSKAPFPTRAGLAAGDPGRDGALPALAAVARGRRARARRSRRRGEHARRAARDRRHAPPARPPPVAAAGCARSGASRLQPSATIVGNMAVRKQPTERGLELAWDAAPQVIEWVLRVSVRPDPRQDYVEGEAETLPGRRALVRGRARRASAPDPALRPRPRRQDRAPRRHLGADERQQRRPVEAAGDRELEGTARPTRPP